MRTRQSTLPNMWPVMNDTLYLTLQLAKVALFCGAIYAFTWFMLAI
jgi:hypothetical protein